MKMARLAMDPAGNWPILWEIVRCLIERLTSEEDREVLRA